MDNQILMSTYRCDEIMQMVAEGVAKGCSLASGLRESGRVYFHALSSLSTKYKQAECDRKCTECLKANRIGVGTFFHVAKNDGIRFKG